MPPSPSSSSPPTAIPTQTHHPHSLSLSPPKKPPPLPWTHEETLNLIRAYREKWYSLKRGQLKASQWEEVSVSVAAFCRLDEPSKSATQCRHKVEKLRKRYRSEKQKPYPNSSWVYFDLMDQLERGPLPISAVAPPPAEYSGTDDDEGDYGVLGNFGSRVSKLGEFEKRGCGFSDSGRKRKVYEEERESDSDDEDGGRVNLVGELGGQMREFAERYVRIERKKMEVMRENERFRMEMENKRLEMILVSQQKTVEMISKVFASSAQNKMKITRD